MLFKHSRRPPLREVTWSDRLRNTGAVAVIVCYLGCTVYFQAMHLRGDPYSHQLAYFWTWDMFPQHGCFSSRLTAVGQTFQGRFVTLSPGPWQQYRGGVYGDLTRADLERSRRLFSRSVDQILKRTQTAETEDPIVKVSFFEQYWPARFNLTNELYLQEYGVPNPRRSYWKLLDETYVPWPDEDDQEEDGPPSADEFDLESAL